MKINESDIPSIALLLINVKLELLIVIILELVVLNLILLCFIIFNKVLLRLITEISVELINNSLLLNKFFSPPLIFNI